MTCIPSGPPSVLKVQVSVSYRYQHEHTRRKPSKLLAMSSKATSTLALYIYLSVFHAMGSYHQPHLRIRNVPGNLGNNPITLPFSGSECSPFHHRSAAINPIAFVWLYVLHLAYGSSRQAQVPSSKLPETRLNR
jgi:hypothetical protein